MIRVSKNSAKKSSREPARFRSTVDSNGRTIWIADAHRDDGKRFVAHADEKLTAFVELESALLAATPRSYPGAVNLAGDFWGASRIEIDEK